MDLLCVFSVLCLLCFCARLFICALWSPAGKGLTSWLSLVVSYCEFVTFPLVSWVRCGTLLYQFLIFAPLLTLKYIFWDVKPTQETTESGLNRLYNVLCSLWNIQPAQNIEEPTLSHVKKEMKDS